MIDLASGTDSDVYFEGKPLIEIGRPAQEETCAEIYFRAKSKFENNFLSFNLTLMS